MEADEIFVYNSQILEAIREGIDEPENASVLDHQHEFARIKNEMNFSSCGERLKYNFIIRVQKLFWKK